MKVFVFLCLVAAAVAVRFDRAAERVPGQYIVGLKDNNRERALSDITRLGGKILRQYKVINSVAISLPEKLVDRLLNLDSIEYVEEDGVAYTQAVTSWGLDRVDQRNLPLDDTYNPPRSGSGVTVYIIDTGLRHSHVDFGGGRASYRWDYQPSNGGEDCNGHGSHCGGTASGTTYGVAPGTQLRSVRVLSCFGSGSWSDVIGGVDSVADASGPRVGSMSLGGGATASLDAAVAGAVAAGAVMSVAAGNDDGNACNNSPAREPTAITVGATDRTDTRASFSNYGTCLDIFAPGVQITSAWHTSDIATNTISGTSMACPHVSGAAALLLARGVPASNVPSVMVNEATQNMVTDPETGSPNLLLYVQ